MKSEFRATLFLGLVTIILGFMSSSCDDINHPADSANYIPVIHAATAGTVNIQPDAFTTCVCFATDQDQDELTYRWTASSGTFPDGHEGATVRWLAPDTPDECRLTVTVTDSIDIAQSSFIIQVVAEGDMGEIVIDIGDTGLKLEMVKIDTGSYEMGAERDSTEFNDFDEYPRHPVRIENSFWIGKYEVTQEFWEAVTDTNPSAIRGAEHPVENVSWLDVKSFIDSLNSYEDGEPWRLPSEAEWEYVCRAGTETIFFWGDDTLYLDLDKWSVSGAVNYIGSHSEVGSRMPNPWGISDMTGNVWEWCEDKPHTSYRGAPETGRPWLGRGPKRRVLRGGSWYDPPQNCRSAERHAAVDSLRFQTVGFRLVRDGLELGF